MTTSRTVVLLTVAVALLGSTGSAQVTARQGTSGLIRFDSPMILEMPLPDISRLPVGAVAALTSDIAKYRCDDVSLRFLSIRVRDRPRSGGTGTMTIEFTGAVHVPPSQDRLVSIGFVAKQAGTTLGSATVKKVDAEEDRVTNYRVILKLDQARLVDAFASDPSPLLEMSVTVSNNG